MNEVTDFFWKAGKVTDEFVKFKSYPERKRVAKVFRGTKQFAHVASLVGRRMFHNYSSTHHN